MRGEVYIFRGHRRPYHKGGGQALPNFGGSLLLMHTRRDAELPNFTRDTWGGACFYVVSHIPNPRRRGPSAPQFWGSFLVMPTPFVAEQPNLTW